MNAVNSIRKILIRDLECLRRELKAYNDEDDIWKIPDGVSNSAGTLAMHLTGNISHFIGAVIGENGYVRDREAEFARKGIRVAEIEKRIDVAREAVEEGLSKINDYDLEKPYPVLLGEVSLTIGEFMVHLVAHFNYHLGQIDYHRRIITGSGNTVGVQNIAEINR